MDEQEFQCRAVNDYYASVTDELDLKEGATYTIMQTSPSGWWYAVNEDGEDGWVPSNYLERIDGGSNSNNNLSNNDVSNVNEVIVNDNDNDNIPVSPAVEEYDIDEEAKQDKKSSIVEQPQPTISLQPKQEQPKVQSQPQPQSQSIQQPKKQEQQSFQQPISQPFQQQSKSVQSPQQQQQKSIQSPSIISSPQPASFNNVRDNAPEKPITEWSVDETLDYLQNGLQARNDFKLTQACRYLTQLATKSDQCEEILSKSGLDIVFEVMRVTAGDVAIQMSCCAAIVVLCANPAAKQYPASTNGIYYISQAVKDNMNYRPFTILAYNAVCNFCHDHPRHRAMALETDIVDQIINGMEHFRGKPEGYKVHSASCLALRNIAADPKGQASVGPRGVEVITKGLEEYRSTKEVVEGSMGVLCNLCALPANGESFVMGGGLQILDNLFNESTTEENTRLAAASVLHNLAANPDTALLLSADEGIDLLVKIIKKSQVDSLLFLNTLKVLAALLFKLPEDNKPAGNKKPEVMSRILQRGIIAALNEAFGYDNKELQEVSATVLVVIAQTNRELAQNLANADAPSRLIEPCMHDPSPQMLHCSLAIFFHVTDAFENQKRLMDAGILEFLTSDWYKKATTREDTVRIGCGVFIKLFSNIRNQVIISQKEKEILEFINYNKQNKPSLTDLCSAIESALQQLDPTSSQSYAVSEKMISQPQSQPQQQQQPKAVNKQPQQPQQPQQQQEAIEEKQIEQPKQVKQMQKQMKLQENVTVQVESNTTPSTGKTHAEEESTIDSTFKPDKLYTYDDLVKKKVNVPADSKEAYLTDEEFKKVFDMTKEQFYKQKPWKQKQLKNQKGLF